MTIKPRSADKPTPGHMVLIVDSEGNKLPVGKSGEITVKVKPACPPGLLKEYWKNPEAMGKSFALNCVKEKHRKSWETVQIG